MRYKIVIHGPLENTYINIPLTDRDVLVIDKIAEESMKQAVEDNMRPWLQVLVVMEDEE